MQLLPNEQRSDQPIGLLSRDHSRVLATLEKGWFARAG